MCNIKLACMSLYELQNSDYGFFGLIGFYSLQNYEGLSFGLKANMAMAGTLLFNEIIQAKEVIRLSILMPWKVDYFIGENVFNLLILLHSTCVLSMMNCSLCCAMRILIYFHQSCTHGRISYGLVNSGTPIA